MTFRQKMDEEYRDGYADGILYKSKTEEGREHRPSCSLRYDHHVLWSGSLYQWDRKSARMYRFARVEMHPDCGSVPRRLVDALYGPIRSR